MIVPNPDVADNSPDVPESGVAAPEIHVDVATHNERRPSRSPDGWRFAPPLGVVVAPFAPDPELWADLVSELSG